jgi:hypothetical protein
LALGIFGLEQTRQDIERSARAPTVMVSHAAFKGITYAGDQPHWTATFSDRPTYVTTKREIQAAQLAKRGAHLAQLLNAIWPQ